MEKIRKAGVTLLFLQQGQIWPTQNRTGCKSHKSTFLVVAECYFLVRIEIRAKKAYEQEKKQTKSLTKQFSTLGKKKKEGEREKDIGLSSG